MFYEAQRELVEQLERETFDAQIKRYLDQGKDSIRSQALVEYEQLQRELGFLAIDLTKLGLLSKAQFHRRPHLEGATEVLITPAKFTIGTKLGDYEAGLPASVRIVVNDKSELPGYVVSTLSEDYCIDFERKAISFASTRQVSDKHSRYPRALKPAPKPLRLNKYNPDLDAAVSQRQNIRTLLERLDAIEPGVTEEELL